MHYLILLLPIFAFGFNPKPLENYTHEVGFNNKALIILKGEREIFSKFYEGNKSTKHLLWSMSKSISSLLFGIAEDKGLISKEAKIDSIFTTHHKYSLKELLYMSSGIEWAEVYDKSPFNSDVVRMLYIERKKSIKDYSLSLDLKKEKDFSYSSGDTNIFMAALNKKLKDEDKAIFPWKWLFDPMGIDAIFERDGQGVFIGSSYVYMSSVDLLKIGKLILNDGRYKSKQLISNSYLKFATKINPFSQRKCDHQMSYGAQFWLNQKCEGQKPLKDVPEDAIALLGYEGQSLFVIPSLDLIVLRLAKDKKKLSLNSYIASVIEGLK